MHAWLTFTNFFLQVQLFSGSGANTWLPGAFPVHLLSHIYWMYDFRDIRNKFFVASNMKDVGLFEQVSMRRLYVINFIKETHCYN